MFKLEKKPYCPCNLHSNKPRMLIEQVCTLYKHVLCLPLKGNESEKNKNKEVECRKR